MPIKGLAFFENIFNALPWAYGQAALRVARNSALNFLKRNIQMNQWAKTGKMAHGRIAVNNAPACGNDRAAWS